MIEWMSECASDWVSEWFVTDKTFHNPEKLNEPKAQEEVPWMSAAHLFVWLCPKHTYLHA